LRAPDRILLAGASPRAEALELERSYSAHGSRIALAASTSCTSDGPSEYRPTPSPGRLCPKKASAVAGRMCSIRVRAPWRHEWSATSAPQSGPNALGGGGQIKITYDICNLWGSTDVWVSTDGGTTYQPSGHDPGRFRDGPAAGQLSLAFGSGHRRHAFRQPGRKLRDTGKLRAIRCRALALVGDEIDFTTVSLTGQFQYDLTTISAAASWVRRLRLTRQARRLRSSAPMRSRSPIRRH